ncbi:MAG: septum formation initiator family protein [Candidatus Nanopelagicales bacterium]
MPALLDAPPVEDVAEGAGEEAVAERRTSGRTLVLFGTLLAIAVMLAIPIRTLLAQRAELDALSTDNAAAQQRVAALTLQQQMWRNPRYIEAQARLRLNMARPGESALIALDHAARADQEKPEAPAVTWYQKLWRSTDTAAGRRAAPATDAP